MGINDELRKTVRSRPRPLTLDGVAAFEGGVEAGDGISHAAHPSPRNPRLFEQGLVAGVVAEEITNPKNVPKTCGSNFSALD